MSLTHQYDVGITDSGLAFPERIPEIAESRWYVAYTNSRHEKRVEMQARERGIECFLPLYQTDPSIAVLFSSRRWGSTRRVGS